MLITVRHDSMLPVYASVFYDTQLACCKAAFGGQTTNACVMGLPNPPTARPSASPSLSPTASPTLSPTHIPLKVPRQAHQQAQVYLPLQAQH
jgi:hypothetical protein